MIVKSMARKTASFGQLIDYMNSNKADETYHLYQNLYHHRLEDIQAEFETNAQLIQKRKNGNILYHEILSITKAQNLSDAEQKALLKNIASRLPSTELILFWILSLGISFKFVLGCLLVGDGKDFDTGGRFHLLCWSSCNLSVDRMRRFFSPWI